VCRQEDAKEEARTKKFENMQKEEVIKIV